MARPESVPLPVLKLTALSLAAAGGGMGFLPAATGRLTGGAGGPGFARVAADAAAAACPFVAGAGMARAGAAGGGGGGGGARACSISSTYAAGVQPCAFV